MKKTIFIYLGILLFMPHSTVLANLEINEIMYDLKTGSDDGRKWVEVFNNSDQEVNLSSFRFFEGDVNHKLTSVQGGETIPPKGYALIISNPAKFNNDWPNFFVTVSSGIPPSAVIFDSTFSFSNTGETLAIKNNEQIIDQYTYSASQGGAGDGDSLQKINNVWLAGLPTPGVENYISVSPKIQSNPHPQATSPVPTISKKE